MLPPSGGRRWACTPSVAEQQLPGLRVQRTAGKQIAHLWRQRCVPRGLIVDQEDQPSPGAVTRSASSTSSSLAARSTRSTQPERTTAPTLSASRVPRCATTSAVTSSVSGPAADQHPHTTAARGIDPADPAVASRPGCEPVPEGLVPELAHHHRAVRRGAFPRWPHESNHVAQLSADVEDGQREEGRPEARRIGPRLELLDPRRQVAERIPGSQIGVGHRLHRCASCVLGKQSGEHPGHVTDEPSTDAGRPPSLPEIVGEPFPGVELGCLGRGGLDPAHGVVESPPKGALGAEPVEGGEELPLVGRQRRRARSTGIAGIAGPVVGGPLAAALVHGQAPRT